jgi:hypothetical protein
LNKIGETTVNLVYGTDIVPRGYSHLKYIKEVADFIKIEFNGTIKKKNPFASFVPIDYKEKLGVIWDMLEGQDLLEFSKTFDTREMWYITRMSLQPNRVLRCLRHMKISVRSPMPA